MWVKRLVRCGEESLVRNDSAYARSTGRVQRSLKGNTKLKEVNRIGVVKGGWGRMWFCSSVRSTPYGSEPTRKQEQRKWIANVSLWRPRWNPKRTEQRTNYYMS